MRLLFALVFVVSGTKVWQHMSLQIQSFTLSAQGKKRRPRRGVFTKGFYFLEKFGIVVNIGYAVFSCLLGISTAPMQL